MGAKYRAVLVGLGNIAWKLGKDSRTGASLSHAAAIESNPMVKLVGGFSAISNDGDAFELTYGVPSFTSLEVMLDELKPEIVSICSPTEFHFDQAKICLDRNIPMLWLEKPPVQTAEQCLFLEGLRVKAKPNIKVSVNYQRRYTESYCNLRKLLIDGDYGEVLYAEIRYSRGLVINGSHMLDLMFFLFGDEEYDVEWVDRRDTTGNPSFMVRYNSGLLINVSGINAGYHCIDVSVTCEKARLSILHGGMTPKVEEVAEHELFPGYFRLKDVNTDVLGAGGFAFAFDKALSDLIDAFEQGRDPSSNLSTACESMRLLELVQEKMRL